MIADSTIDSVRDLSVADIIRRYVPLTRKGSSLMGCCPFHGERNPSMSVSEEKGLWHCFSCRAGGDGISFVMRHEAISFEDAVASIAADHNIEIKYTEAPTEEQRQEAERKKTMAAVLDSVQAWFCERLGDDTPEAEAARRYAADRWGDEYCAACGIGLAPEDPEPFMRWAADYGIDREALLSLGLIKKSKDTGAEYPFFRGRLTIPIRTRSRRLQGFTARYIGQGQKAKYFNSADSPLYSKSDSLFGADVAARAAADKGYVIFVEGAPDVMRMQLIGIPNAVASLGTALTSKQLDIIRSMTSSICFIPDADVPKADGQLAPGHRAVIANGTRAVAEGFMVTVREIPLGSRRLTAAEIKERWPGKENRPDYKDCVEPVKADPDSYFREAGDFYDLPEVDFIVWMARKKFPLAQSMAQQQKVISEIADLLAQIDDEARKDSIYRELAKISGTYTLWKKAARQARIEAGADDSKTKLTDLDTETRRYGFLIRDNCYWSTEDDQEKKRLSNFILEPLFHIIDQNDGTRIFRIRNRYGLSSEIIFRESELVNLSAFNIRVGSLGSYMWKGSGEWLQNIREYCFENTKSAYPVDRLGWQSEYGFYAFGNGIYAAGRFIPADDMGIVPLDDGTFYFLPATSSLYRADRLAYQFERKFIHGRTSGLTMRQFASELTGIFGDHGLVAFCYLLATIFRDICYAEINSFPHLNLFGEKGTGKTTLASLIQTLFIPFEKPASIGAMTIPALNDALTLAVNYLTVIDEYKNDLPDSKINFLKTSFDGAGQQKKNMDGDKKGYRSIIQSAMALCGQDKPTQDMAIFSRVIFLHLTRTQFSQDEKRRLDDFIHTCSRSNTHLLMEILARRAEFESQFRDMFRLTRSVLDDECRDEIMVRLLDSWAVPLTALRILEQYIDIPFSFRQALPIFAGLCAAQNADLDQGSEMADFWATIQGLYTQGKIVEKAHFRIKEMDSFTSITSARKGQEGRRFIGMRKILFLNPPAVSMLFGRANSGSPTANRSNWSTMLSYLKGQGYYLGTKQDRFMILRANGEPDIVTSGSGPAVTRQLRYNRPKALCFDYDILREKYGLELESETAPSIDDEQTADSIFESAADDDDPFAGAI